MYSKKLFYTFTLVYNSDLFSRSVSIPLNARTETRDQFSYTLVIELCRHLLWPLVHLPFTCSSVKKKVSHPHVASRRWIDDSLKVPDQGWFKTSRPNESESCFVALAVRGPALSRSKRSAAVLSSRFFQSFTIPNSIDEAKSHYDRWKSNGFRAFYNLKNKK